MFQGTGSRSGPWRCPSRAAASPSNAVAVEYTHLVNAQDFAKTRLQVGAEGSSSVAGVLVSAVRAGGLRRIYVGYASALARGVPGAAVVFSVYGAVYERLGGS